MTKGSQTSLAQLIAQIQQGSIHIDFIHSSLTFPEKLFIILERDLHDEFIQWAGNGLCFRIIDEDGFITHVIPQYFKHSKFSSFLRQLNSYGFRKIVRGEELGCYFHPKFQQHRIDFISMVHRVMGKIELPSFEEVLRATQASSRTSSSSALSRCSSSAKQGLSKSKTSSADFAEIISTESIGGSSLSTDDFTPPKPDANTSSFCLRAPWNPYESEQQPSSISPGSLIRAGMVDVKPQITSQDMELEIPSFDVSEEDKRLQLLTISPDIFRDETEKAAWFLCQSPVLSPPRMSSLHSNMTPFIPAYTHVPQPPPPTAPPAPLPSTANQKVLFQSYNNYYL